MRPRSNTSGAIAAVSRSLPDPNRPRMSDEIEHQLEPLDRRSALAYADAELATERLAAVVEDIASDGVPVEELFGDTSLVTHIEELRAIAREAEEP